jgi:23S rRNA (adenine2503-C2)-methyltransferase
MFGVQRSTSYVFLTVSPAQSIHDLPYPVLGDLLEAEGINRVHVLPLWRVLYRGIGLNTLPPPLRRWMDTNVGEGKRFHLDRLEVEDEIHSEDGRTRKFLLRLEDGQVIETVLMGYDGRHTVCVSSQAGCAMGCVFCATGQMGFVRSLRPGEIVAQVLHARKVLKRFHPEARVRNLVFMGMGEPLDNYEGVMDALSILSEERGIGMAPSKITVSTVGVIPGIQRLAAENRPYNLAVSLHGSTEEERSALVPASKRWPLADLIAACRAYGEDTGKRIFIQWSLIEGKNDSPETARRLVKLLEGMNVQVNLIPLNPTGGYSGVASPRGKAFQQVLRDAGMPCTFRQRRGIDVAAGCGMLKAERKNGLPTFT